jgi:calcineurin-like phosphoesterase family protein
MSKLIKCPESLCGITKRWKVFLAGPIQGAPEWQFTLPSYDNPVFDDVVWISPRRDDKLLNDFNHTEQVQWETDALRMSNIILFWIPKSSEDIDGRSYAQTTRFELGENIARGKNIIIGAYDEFPGRLYFEYKTTKYNNILGKRVCHSLEECLDVLETYIIEHRSNPKTFFTSDTHFGSERALTLSKRPFSSIEEMNWTMIERWNNVVSPYDTVWHLGDFGDNWPLDYLSGDKFFIKGNYERDGKTGLNHPSIPKHAIHDGVVTLTLNVNPTEEKSLVLSHEPLTGKHSVLENQLCLFGHIHGRQKIKRFGIDVGVDCNNFTPMSFSDVLFYDNALKKGYYDEEVFCS